MEKLLVGFELAHNLARLQVTPDGPAGLLLVLARPCPDGLADDEMEYEKIFSTKF